MRVYLVGFMGSGKTTVGRLLAERRGVPFVDLDAVIEAAAGMPVREIFAREGEAAFRVRESSALAATLAWPDAVVATGGGTLTREENRALIRAAGVSVWLHPPFATIQARIGHLGKADRPLFQDERQAFGLYRERLPLYQKADLVLDIEPGEPAEQVAARLELLLGAVRSTLR